MYTTTCFSPSSASTSATLQDRRARISDRPERAEGVDDEQVDEVEREGPFTEGHEGPRRQDGPDAGDVGAGEGGDQQREPDQGEAVQGER